MSDKLVLIDGHSILNRAFYGMPDLTNSKGVHTGAVYGFLNIMFRILDEEKPQFLAVAFDLHAPTFRHKVYEAYKGTRHPMPDELREQVPLIKKVLHAMGIFTCEQEGLEADDILGTLAKKSQAEGMEVRLVSGDRDLLQIADEHIQIRIPKTKKGQTTIENYFASDVMETMSVTPLEFIEVKALQGDTSDNIPGVPKVGPKTATELIVRYHSVEGVYEHLDEITKKGLHDTLAANKEQAELSLFLARIKTDADVELDRSKARIEDFYTPAAYEIYTELGFKNFLGRFDKGSMNEAITAGQDFSPVIVKDRKEAERIFEDAEKEELTAVFPVYDSKALLTDNVLLAAAVTISSGSYFIIVNGTGDNVPLGQLTFDFGMGKEKGTAGGDGSVISGSWLEEKLEVLRKSVRKSDFKRKIAVFDVKPQFKFWKAGSEEFKEGIDLTGMLDLLIMAYLINPLKNDYEPEDIASEYLSATIQGRKAFLEKSSFEAKLSENEAAVSDYACHISDALFKAAPVILEKLKEENMWKLYKETELPLSYVLYDMQRIGIHVVPQKLKKYGDSLSARINELDKKIHEEAGDDDFNISSPKQLGEVLFEKMMLPGGKKTKTGYSTAADVLEKLAEDYPVAADIMEYRALTKLKSTYADGLVSYIAADSRIHTAFNQTVTATGRLSSSDPNLQNIPMRTDLGREIRKVFIPGKEGWSFTDADYSQIELRILASMSGDESLIEAFRQNKDIHRATASMVFHVPFDEVTPLMRRNAKAVNFGIVYGISSFGLSQNLSISRKEAQDYINEYFVMFPGIKSFLDGLVSSAKESGYSVTLFGRRRPIPDLKNSNFMKRQFGERVAMNAPIQGTGADIMKIAMIRVWESIAGLGLKSRLILQIHDELLIETAPGEEESVAKLLKEGMTGAADLAVELDADCHNGADWFEAK